MDKKIASNFTSDRAALFVYLIITSSHHFPTHNNYCELFQLVIGQVSCIGSHSHYISNAVIISNKFRLASGGDLFDDFITVCTPTAPDFWYID